MRYTRLLASAFLIAASVSHAGAQTSKPGPDVVVAPFIVEADNAEALRSQAAACLDQLASALARKGVALMRDPKLSEKNLRSAPAPWAVLGRISRDKGQFQLELRLLDVKSGDEMRSYFNSDKDLAVACRATEKAAERIAAFVAEQRPTTP